LGVFLASETPSPCLPKVKLQPNSIIISSNTTDQRRSFPAEASSGVASGSALQFFGYPFSSTCF